MLTLQRASAGSGKTFTLTKRFIEMLITVASSDGPTRRLRTMPELADSVQHILAVTFTNKATNEMKERIVGKLYELAYPPAGKRPDYMDYFTQTYAVSEADVSAACREALHQVLYEYSDFNISTIDAFFQNILRTFAYESELPDSYQVLIDSEHVAATAATSLVDDISAGDSAADDRYWVRHMIDKEMKRGGAQWNLFQQRQKGKAGSGVFGALSKVAAQIDDEEYSAVRQSLDEYFDAGHSLRQAAESIERDIADKAADLFAPLPSLARSVLDAYTPFGDPASLLPYGEKNAACLRALMRSDADPMGEYKLDTRSTKHVNSKVPKALSQQLLPYADTWRELCDAFKAWKNYLQSDEVSYWELIKPALPKVALTNTLRQRVNDYLLDIGAMKIADTNTMIHRIIADDDVPFIYERLGTRLNHFLIDEFQDTSLKQWDNFRPLLLESESHAHPNLIIGDAKQSIYRFRGAEPTLITDIVPSTFSDADIRGYSKEENSNWRSRLNIVRFNNIFFSSLAARLSDRIATLYANTVQYPRSREPQRGYVEVNFYDRHNLTAPFEDVTDNTPDSADSADASQDSEAGRKIPLPIISRIGNLITSLLRRGYRQKEVAVIVNSRQAGKEVIAGLMAYNNTLGEGDEILEFVSEDSLTLDTSSAVTTLVECFRLIQDSVEGKERPADSTGRQTSRSVNWIELQNSFSFFSARNPGKSLQERLREFMEMPVEGDTLGTLIAGMQAITLPSLTEALAEVFRTPQQRRTEAPFIAAFQDAVLDYCEANPTDIGSMLRWWDTSGKRICVSSPEDTDAINVMTIHKSKGLEFECVILPDIDLRLDMRRSGEEMWVPIPTELSYSARLPKLLPITLSSKVAEGTAWADIYAEERHRVQTDQINKAYVAFTRAVSELYIYLPGPFKKQSTDSDGLAAAPQLSSADAPLMRHHAYEICRDVDALIEQAVEADAATRPDAGEDYSYMLPPQGALQKEDEWQVRYGEPLQDVATALARQRSRRGGSVESRKIGRYYINSDREILKYHPEGTPPVVDSADDDRIDPRSEGSLKHAVLEHVVVASDIPHALSKIRSRGLITRRMMREYEASLGAAIEWVSDRHWFDGTYRVLNERPLLHPGELMKRPDRVMTDADGGAIVIDYKFGDPSNIKAHRRQVGEYMGRLMATGRFTHVKGYIWYVNHQQIEEVEKMIPFRPRRKGAGGGTLSGGW